MRATRLQASVGESPAVAARRALAGFGLEDASAVSIEPLGGYRTTGNSLRVRAGGEAWVLKRHTSAAEIGRLEASHRLEERLATEGFPTAPLRRSLEGETLFPDGPARYSLHAWVSGQQLAIADRDAVLAQDPGLVVSFGALLGTLHRISAGLGPGAGGVSAIEAAGRLQGPAHALRALRRPRRTGLSRWHSLRLKRHKSDFDRWIIDVLPEVADSVRWLAGRSLGRGLTTADVGLIHNDINWENLVFDDELRVAGLLDFDNAIPAPWSQEVGAAAVVLAGTRAEHVDAFVGAYEEVAGRPIDRTALHLGMRLKCTQSLLNSINTYLRGDVRDIDLLSSWCVHLHASLVELGRA